MSAQSEAQTIERIESDECARLLHDRSLGRVGINRAGELVILPVFYAVLDDDIVFRTAPGTKLDAAVMKTRVAFEVDNGAPAWSVLVHGHCEEIRDHGAQVAARAQLGSDWPAGQRERLVRIRVETISGRRLVPVH
jgi:nitroimidazol reductase NimA-like FMN-containing flavoprotein (pyridoxamine 5'-phosphate oxidase superfamily)